MPTTVAIFSRSPSDPRIKARLLAGLPLETQRRELVLAFLDDLVERCQGIAGVSVRVAVTPPVEGLRMSRPQFGSDSVITQRGTSASDRQKNVVTDLTRLGFTTVVLMGSDVPDLPALVISQAITTVNADASSIAVGPTTDGGYYLLGLQVRPGDVPDLFSTTRWSTPHECADLCAAVEHAGRRVVRLEEWRDVDTPDDLAALSERLRQAPDTARHTAAILQQFKA